MPRQWLRHGFGVAAISAGIPLNLVQKWLGHAQLTTTAMYADAVGAVEKTSPAHCGRESQVGSYRETCCGAASEPDGSFSPGN